MGGINLIVPASMRKERDCRVKKGQETTGCVRSQGGGTTSKNSGAVEADVEEWPKTLFSCAEQIKKMYPGIHFGLESSVDSGDIDGLAKFYGSGVHLLVAPEFLQGMISSPEAFAKGKEVLQKLVQQMHTMAKQVATDGRTVLGMGAAIKEDGKASIWTLAQEPWKLPELLTEQRKKQNEELMSVRHYQDGGRNITEIKTMDGGMIRFIYTKRINYSASGDIGRLARFTEVGSVHAFIGGLRAYMNQISHDPYLDRAEIQRAIAQMKGVLLRADKKVQDLNGEDMLESARCRAIEARKKAKAQKFAEELKQRKLARKIREYIDSSQVKGPLSDITSEMRYEREQQRYEANTAIETVSSVSADLAVVDVISAELGIQGASSAAADVSTVAVSTATVDVQV